MSEGTEGIQHMLDNPEEIDLESLAEAGLINKDGTLNEDEEEGQARNDKGQFIKEESKDADPGDTGDVNSDDEDPEGTVVRSKDGSKEIPYEVLAGARSRNRDLKTQIGDYEQSTLEKDQRIQELEASIAQSKANVPDVEELIDVDGLDPDLYEEEYGKEIGDIVRELQRSSKDQVVKDSVIMEKLEELSAFNEANINSTINETAEVSQGYVDDNPTLALWQEQNGKEWEMASKIDEMLSNDPDYDQVPIDMRFNAVVDMVNTSLGNDPIASSTSDPTAKGSPEDDSNLTSLSHMAPSGKVATNEVDRLENMPIGDLSRAMGKMSEDDRQRWFDKNLGG